MSPLQLPCEQHWHHLSRMNVCCSCPKPEQQRSCTSLASGCHMVIATRFISKQAIQGTEGEGHVASTCRRRCYTARICSLHSLALAM